MCVQTQIRTTKIATPPDGQGPKSSEICRIFPFSFTHLEIKAPEGQIVPVLPNFFAPGIFFEILNLPDFYFRRNIKKLKLI